MNVLVACEESQAVCKAFREHGHRAFSCDLQECSGGHPEWHIVGDCLPLINGNCEFKTSDTHTHTARRVGFAHSASALHLPVECGSLQIISDSWSPERGTASQGNHGKGFLHGVLVREVQTHCHRESEAFYRVLYAEAFADHTAV